MPKRKDFVRIAFVVVLAAVFCFVRRPQSILANQFIHANVFHLAMNCMAVWAVLGRTIRHDLIICGMSYLIGLMVLPLCSIHTIGASSIVFAAIGLQADRFLCKPTNRLLIATALVVGALVPNVAFAAHLLPFVYGLIVWFFKKVLEDYGEWQR